MAEPPARSVRCAIYTRKSTEEGLEQNFNSLHAQREAAEAYILSQRHAGWTALTGPYDDGGFTGGNTERPALKKLLADIEAGRVDCVVVYKVDRLSRSLLDFSQLMALFDRHGVSFVSVTQEFNTSTSLGRLTLHILLSFAQFEREIISERTRDKVSAARRKGKWTGGIPILGYDVDPLGGRLVKNHDEAKRVCQIFAIAARAGTLTATLGEINRTGLKTKEWTSRRGRHHAGRPFHKMSLRALLGNVLYTGVVTHKGILYPGEHEAILDRRLVEKVNRRLDEGGRHQGRPHQKQNAPLAGRLYCACGARMVPTYAVNHGKRYPYYTCENRRNHESPGRHPRVARIDIDASLGQQLASSPGTPAAPVEKLVERVTFNATDRRVSVILIDQSRMEYVLPAPVRRGIRALEPKNPPSGRVPRISRLMALAITLQDPLRAGQRSGADVARWGQVSRSRLSQILSLNNLAPAIQEELLTLPKTTQGADRVTEKTIRPIALMVDWGKQICHFRKVMR